MPPSPSAVVASATGFRSFVVAVFEIHRLTAAVLSDDAQLFLEVGLLGAFTTSTS